MTSQSYTFSAPQSSWAPHCSWLATIATACATVPLSLLAYVQYGKPGAWTILAFGLVNVASIGLTSLLAAFVAARRPSLAGLASSSGVRMILPLVAALVVVAGRGRLSPVQTVYYIVPLFLCSLAADVVSHVRELQRESVAMPVNLPRSQCDEVS